MAHLGYLNPVNGYGQPVWKYGVILNCCWWKSVGADHKPNSVPPIGHPNRRRRSFIWDTGCPATQAAYPGARTGSPQTPPYLALHRVGFTQLLRSPGELVRSYRTVSPLPCQYGKAVCFLLHLPSRHRDSTLWSTLPYGVRTFLQPEMTTSDRLVYSDRKLASCSSQ